MGCLVELIFEILVEGLFELIAHCYMKLMALIVPEKELTKKTIDNIKNAVTVISIVILLTLLTGFFLMLVEDMPVVKAVGKFLTYGSLTVICVQIILGIVMKILNRNKNSNTEE